MTFEYGPFVLPEQLYSREQLAATNRTSNHVKLADLGPVYEIEVPHPHDATENFLHFAVAGFEDPAITGSSRYDQIVEAIGDGEDMLMRRIRPSELRRLKKQPQLPLAPDSNLIAIDLK